MTYIFDADIASLFGVDEAIMIQNLSFWIMKNEANGKHFHEGRFWTYNSVEAFTKLFPFWTARQIRRILQSLIDKGVVVTGNFNTSAYDRTTWYAFGDSFLRNGKIHLPKAEDGSLEKVNSNNIVDVIPDNNTDNNPNEATAGCGLFPDEPVGKKLRGTSEGKAVLFEHSRFAKFEDFQKEFDKPEFADIDIAYYFNAVADWSAQKGKKMKDWIATARNFIRGDAEKGKLHRLSGTALSESAVKYLKAMSE